jgi:phosphatidylglycerol:prolipoprotein diacylglycerol transferase
VKPVLFTSDRLVVHTFSVVMALFLLAGLALLAQQQRRWQDDRLDAGLWVLGLGLVGARLAHVAASWDYYAERPGEIFALGHGGFSLHGGLLAGVLALGLFAWVKARRSGQYLERLSYLAAALLPVIALGLVGGWLACLLGGCAHGRAVPPPQRWYTPDWPDLYGVYAFRLPSQLLGLALALLLLALARPLSRHPGLFLALYGAGDFLIGFTRGDLQLAWGPLLVAQWVDLGLIALGVSFEAIRAGRLPLPATGASR